MKRILLFVLTNVAVMAVVGLVSSLFGLGRYVGTNTGQLMIFSLLVGFTGAIVSLLMSTCCFRCFMAPALNGQAQAAMNSEATAINPDRSPDPNPRPRP